VVIVVTGVAVDRVCSTDMCAVSVASAVVTSGMVTEMLGRRGRGGVVPVRVTVATLGMAA